MIQGRKSSDLFQHLFEEQGFVFSPFEGQGRHTVRLSPNVFNTEEETARFFDVATQP